VASIDQISFQVAHHAEELQAAQACVLERVDHVHGVPEAHRLWSMVLLQQQQQQQPCKRTTRPVAAHLLWHVHAAVQQW
jgi:hypothetical protein